MPQDSERATRAAEEVTSTSSEGVVHPPLQSFPVRTPGPDDNPRGVAYPSLSRSVPLARSVATLGKETILRLPVYRLVGYQNVRILASVEPLRPNTPSEGLALEEGIELLPEDDWHWLREWYYTPLVYGPEDSLPGPSC